ncbi:MAG: fructose-bisphosphatase class I [Arcobacter butzleri]|nr:fructose-bisphosphatase class I [Aliarcobacter butzleri]
MIEIFNAISNIAEQIEKDIFKGVSDEFFDVTIGNKKVQEKIYDRCMNIIEKEFEHVPSIKGALSQDKKQMCTIHPQGKYVVSYVSIDNVELLDVDYSLGTIFCVYEGEISPKNIVISAYITYGPTFQMVYASKSDGVKFFSHECGRFMQKESFKLNQKGNINSTGGDISAWTNEHKNLIQSFFDNGYRLRYSDSLTLDTHQILFKRGGIYSNPATKNNPNGTMELIFECYPISFIVELAGGEAIDGKYRILDIESLNVHHKSPFYFGSSDEIKRVKELFGA